MKAKQMLRFWKGVCVAERQFAVLYQIAEIAEEFLVGLTLHGESPTTELTLTDGVELLRTAVAELEHLRETAAAAFLLLEVILHLVLLAGEDDDRIGVPVGREVALPVLHHTHQTVDGRDMLRIGHEQVAVVDDEQLPFHIIESTLGETIDPLVIF